MTEGAAAEALWRALAEKAIGGPIDGLTSTTVDGVAIAPLGARGTADAPRPWRVGGWSVSARVDHPDAGEANRLALLDLDGGADALTIVAAGGRCARGFGLDVDGAEHTLEEALAAVELDFIAVRLDAGPSTRIAARALARLIEARRLGSAGLRVDLGHDPIGLLATSGIAVDDALAALLALARDAGLAGRVLMADGRPYHEAGAGAALELACVLATGVAYLRRLEGAGLSLDAGRDTIAFLLAIDADVFPGLAKARALRRLWARIEAASGLVPKPMRLHAETSWRMMTKRDPWTNAMRATAAAFAAGVGGVDVSTVLPFTLPLGLPDAAARRLARNAQRVLIDEANLAMVDDPAAGSGGLETLTDGLCERAWALFQTIEAEGGIEASLRAGALPARIAESARTRAAAIARGQRGIVGTTLYPSLAVPEPAVLDVAPRAPLGDGLLPSIRDSAPFEALRDRADAVATRPTVFLATLGAPAAHGARATEAANLLAAGGLACVTPEPALSRDALVSAFQASGARVACLCGTDEAYAKEAADLVAALRAAGARRVLLSGAPTVDVAAIDAVLHDGCDRLDILGAALAAATRP